LVAAERPVTAMFQLQYRAKSMSIFHRYSISYSYKSTLNKTSGFYSCRIFINEKFDEDTKGVTTSRTSKDRQLNGLKKNHKGTNSGQTTQWPKV
jgi:hypothetical protein